MFLQLLTQEAPLSSVLSLKSTSSMRLSLSIFSRRSPTSPNSHQFISSECLSPSQDYCHHWLSITVCLWFSLLTMEGQYYSLDLQCPLKACVSKAWSPACGVTGRWWDIYEVGPSEKNHGGVRPWRALWDLWPFFCLLASHHKMRRFLLLALLPW